MSGTGITQGNRFYTSPKLKELTDMYPIRQTIGTLCILLAENQVLPKYGATVFANSPAQNREVEVLFGDLLKYAVQQDRWVGYNIGWIPRKIEYAEAAVRDGRDLSEEARGVIAARDKGLLELIVSDERVYATPTESFVGFVFKRLQELS